MLFECLLRIAAWFRMVKRIESIWLFNRLSYYHSVAFYILMTAWKENLKNSTKKNWKLQKKNWSLKKLEKLGKRRNFDFKGEFCTWLAAAQNISLVVNHDNFRFWLSSILLSSSKVISWSISNVLIPEYRNDYFKTHINYLYLMGSTWLLLVYQYFT